MVFHSTEDDVGKVSKVCGGWNIVATKLFGFRRAFGLFPAQEVLFTIL
jgi:hypothetical protein